MGNIQSFSKVSYGSVQDIVMKNTNALLVCTLDKKNEQYAIEKTIAIENEENVINNMMKKRQHDLIIVIYGENMYDDTVIKKYTQLKKIGFKNCYIYFGGLFEWFLLQDVYGQEVFPTMSTPMNGCLSFKPIGMKPFQY
tara:strand:+ start:2960 stop:3376 length:417 start_codon:yes stop_codon:yes gene_type:complete